MKGISSEEQKNEIEKLRKIIEKLTKEKNKIYSDYDRVRV